MQLQVGRTYSTSTDTVVTIVEESDHNLYPFTGNDGTTYTSKGTYFQVGGSALDLVKEIYTEPKSVTISYSLLNKLISLAQRETHKNYSTYVDGIASGQTHIAREILKELGIKWGK